MRVHSLSFLVLSTVAALAPAGRCQPVPIFSQPTTSDESKVGLGWYSQSEPRVRKNYKHADDFVLAETVEVGRVVWWGQSSLHTHPDLRNFDSFQIEFLEAEGADGAWLPGALVFTETIAIEGTSAQATGRQTPAGALEYRHDATLTSPASLEGGRRYFLAVSAGMIETGFSSDAWQWQDADLHDGWSGVYSWAASEWTGMQDSDSAFELYAVPAPLTLTPLAAGLLAWSARRR